MIEDCFEDDDDKDGVNALRTYSVKMRLMKKIPQKQLISIECMCFYIK